jgi:hypothetical protein
MAHFPVPSVAMRMALGLILALGYAAALFALLVFLSGDCPIGGVGPLLLLWVAFSLPEVPATLAGPGNHSRLFKRAAFGLLVAGAAVALFLGPSPDCGTGGTPTGTASIVLIASVAAVAVIALATRRLPRQAHLTRLGPGERRSDRISRGR